MAGLTPSCIVIVATARALKYNGGVPKADTGKPNREALEKGIVNLGAHIDNMRQYGVPVVVAINKFLTDDEGELSFIENYCRERGADFALSEVFGKGGEGGVELANKVVEACEKENSFHFLYEDGLTVEEKITAIAKKIYGADGVVFEPKAKKALGDIKTLGGDNMPVCIAKTQYSLSDKAALLGRPTGFTVTIRDIRLSNGAGFVVAYAGDIMTMPGLPKAPAAQKIDCDADGVISGLF